MTTSSSSLSCSNSEVYSTLAFDFPFFFFSTTGSTFFTFPFPFLTGLTTSSSLSLWSSLSSEMTISSCFFFPLPLTGGFLATGDALAFGLGLAFVVVVLVVEDFFFLTGGGSSDSWSDESEEGGGGTCFFDEERVVFFVVVVDEVEVVGALRLGA